MAFVLFAATSKTRAQSHIRSVIYTNGSQMQAEAEAEATAAKQLAIGSGAHTSRWSVTLITCDSLSYCTHFSYQLACIILGLLPLLLPLLGLLFCVGLRAFHNSQTNMNCRAYVSVFGFRFGLSTNLGPPPQSPKRSMSLSRPLSKRQMF